MLFLLVGSYTYTKSGNPHIKGSPKILIFGESVEQGGVLYKCIARSRTSLSLSEDYRNKEEKKFL